MAASMSKLLITPLPPSHATAADTSQRFLPPRASPAASFPRSSARRRVAVAPYSLVSGRLFASTAFCAAQDHAGATGLAAADEEELDDLPFVQLSSDILHTELSLLKDDAPSASSSLLAALHRGDSEGDRRLGGEAAAYPAAMKALYAACLAGNVTEQLWNFTWPAAMATLHPSLLPVAVLGFFTKLVVFAAGPLVGDLMSSLPPILAYRSLTVIQTGAHWVSAAMIAYAFTLPRASTAAALLLKPWFAVLVASTAVDRLSCVSLGVMAERDFVVQVQLFLGGAMNRLADGIFDHSTIPGSVERPEHGSKNAASAFRIKKKVEEAWTTIKHGWVEYIRQPVLPASLAYVLVCFNVALAPGALMTTFLMHHGVSASVIGAFGCSSAAMGILATFMAPILVKELGILKAGAAGLIAQSALLGAAVLVFLAGPVSRQGRLLVFLGLIVASRLGHMAYSVVSLQVVQTGNPMRKAKLIGATEIAVASLAELGMMAVAVVARDAAHFGWLAVLSAGSVAAAACLFCAWLANPTGEVKRLFQG
nr:unnamed protein product [Digitaria exilis]